MRNGWLQARNAMPTIPSLSWGDHSLGLMLDPHGFIPERCRRLRTEVFAATLSLRKTICMTGPEAAELFSDADRFDRAGAMQAGPLATLRRSDASQDLDLAACQHRQQMLQSLQTQTQIDRLAQITRAGWRREAQSWPTMPRVEVVAASARVLARAACTWAGVLHDAELPARTQDLGAMFVRGGAWARYWPPYWPAWRARRRVERWVVRLIEQVRSGQLMPRRRSPLEVIATHRDIDGRQPRSQEAAQLLISLIQPVIAAAVDITLALVALHQQQGCRQQMRGGEARYRAWFVQEVQRFHAFVPFEAATVRSDFKWRGYRFPKGTRVLLDLTGTDHASRSWRQPARFCPERFREWSQSPYDFVAQGDGRPCHDHRNPDQRIGTALISSAVAFFVDELDYRVPPQDLHVNPRRKPALPRGGFSISQVRVGRPAAA